jgi:hypothetical protein
MNDAMNPGATRLASVQRHLARRLGGLAACLLAVLGAACTHLGPGSIQDLTPAHELVLEKGDAVTAENRHGTIRIEALTVLKRHYEWVGGHRTTDLIPRSSRWNGSYGLYQPATQWVFDPRIRVVAEEGQLDFGSEAEALEWLSMQRPFDWVYNGDGLVVGWFRSPQRNQVSVEVWQFLIRGEPATRLPGYDNARVVVARSP